LAYKHLEEADKSFGWKLVHGEVDYIGGRMRHAWLERAGRVYDAVLNRFFDADAFVRIASPTPLATYSIMEAARMVVSSRHFGAWTEPPGENCCAAHQPRGQERRGQARDIHERRPAGTAA
jgi:hypothetical protein